MSEDRNELDYRDGKLDRPERSRAIAQFTGGIIIGVIPTGIVGFFAAVSTLSFGGVPVGPRSLPIGLICLFCLAALLGGILTVPMWRRRRFVLAGYLCGMAVTALIAGLCFAAQ